MGKRDRLKRNLKAASRRRDRRSAATPVPPSSAARAVAASPRVDVFGALCEPLIAYLDSAKQPRDESAAKVLRGVRDAKVLPETDDRELAKLQTDVSLLPARSDITPAQFADAVEHFLELVREHRSSADPAAALHFLAVLTS